MTTIYEIKKIIDSLEFIKKMCTKIDNCRLCPFYDQCLTIPKDWIINKDIYRWDGLF